MTRLPSLTALRSFEAAARLQSMTKAATELCVTHGAISRQIQALEADLGIKLLHRLPRTLEPTEEGERLSIKLSAAFATIAEAVVGLRSGPIVLSCSASLTMRWLIPRLSDFKTSYPHILLQLSASHGPIEFARDGVDVALRNDVVEAPVNVRAQPLAREYIGPVCSPFFARQHDIRHPADLERLSLLATQTRPNAWQDWSDASGKGVFHPKDSYEHFYVAIQAALCGLGVAMAPLILVEDDLRAGALVAPFGFVPGCRNLELWSPPDKRPKSGVADLERWLRNQIAAMHNEAGSAQTDLASVSRTP